MKNIEVLIDQMKNEIIQGIQQNLSIYSVKGEPALDAPYGEAPKQALLDAIIQGENLGLKVVNIDNVIGYAEIGQGEEMVAILGHLDVVPLGDGWDFDPLGKDIIDGKLYGRGTTDDKGPTIGAMYALKAIKDSGIQLDRRIRVIFGTDEESGSGCVKHYIETGQEMPVAGFTPDAQYPIINAEKGIMGVMVSKKLAKAVNNLISLSGGVANNVVMPEVSFEIKTGKNLEEFGLSKTEFGYKGSFNGKPAHASTPQKGENALYKLAKFAVENSFEGEYMDVFNFINSKINFETNGSSLGIKCEDEPSGEITLSVGVIKLQDDEISFNLDIRYPVTKDGDYISQILKKEIEASGLEIKSLNDVKPLYVPQDALLIKTLQKVYSKQTGESAELIGIGGGTYAKSFPNMVAFGPSFPGDEDVIHQANEYINIENLIKSIKISAISILELANS